MILDRATGLYFARARTYDARTGRFVSKDSLAGVTRRPETLNPYPFVFNQPTAWRDPSGKFGVVELAAVAAILYVLNTTSVARDSFARTRNHHLNTPPPGVNINANMEFARVVAETRTRLRRGRHCCRV